MSNLLLNFVYLFHRCKARIRGHTAIAHNHRGYGQSDRARVNDLAPFTPPFGRGPLESRLCFATYFEYDDMGRFDSITDALGGVTEFEHNDVSLLTQKADPLGGITAYDYDLERNLTSVSDSMGRVTSYSYDDLDRLTAVVDTLENVTSYSYDPAGNLASVTDANGNSTSYEYNDFGLVTAAVDPLGNRKQYEYDIARNLVSASYPRGNKLIYKYDALNRLVEKEVWFAGMFQYKDDHYYYNYDATGNLLSAENNNGYLEYDYDALGRTTLAATNPFGDYETPSAVFAYGYDALGNRVSMTDPNGGVTEYRYDARNAITSITNPYGEATSYAYDPLGRRESMMRPNGVETTYVFDAASRITEINHLNGGAVLDYFHYTYDLAGNRTSMTRPEGAHEYTYDDLDRLTGATHPWPDLPSESFAYDPLGNRIGTVVNGANRLLEDDEWTYTYDANGNMTARVSKTDAESWLYEYNGEDRLRHVRKFDVAAPGEEPPVVEAYYDYDALMNRVAKWVYSDCVEEECDENGSMYVYTGEDVWGVYGLELDLLYEITHGPGIDEPISLSENGNRHYYLADALGSVWGTADHAGAVEDTNKYSAYGVPDAVSSAGLNWRDQFRYTGREFDTESGFYYHRFRYYIPDAGRFNRPDPLGYVLGRKFGYGLNNPTRYVDLFGLQTYDTVDPSQNRGWRVFNRVVDWFKDLFSFIFESPPELEHQILYSEKDPKKTIDLIEDITELKKYDNRRHRKKKSCKNPYGSRGKPDHQQKVDELTLKALDECEPGEKVLTEKKIKGHESNRRPDVQIVDPGEETRKVLEAERYPNRKYNKIREQEYEEIGLDYETHELD